LTTAFADTGPSDKGESSELDTVIVNARRIGTSLEEIAGGGALGSRKLLDTSFSIAVVDEEEISRRQVNSVAQIFINDPSIVSACYFINRGWNSREDHFVGHVVKPIGVDAIPRIVKYPEPECVRLTECDSWGDGVL